MAEKELKAEVVQSEVWLYDGTIQNEVWIVKQNFDWYYDEGFEDEPEALNSDGEVFQVVFARDSRVTSVSLAKQTLSDAVAHARELIPQGIRWTNHFSSELFRGRWYSLTP